MTVLSVFCPRERIDRIDFERADASEVVTTLAHSMKFSRGKGIAAVQPLDPEPFLATGPYR